MIPLEQVQVIFLSFIKLDILNYLVDEWKNRKDTDDPLTLILISHDISS